MKSEPMAMREIRRYQVYRLERTPKQTVMTRLRRMLKLRTVR